MIIYLCGVPVPFYMLQHLGTNSDRAIQKVAMETHDSVTTYNKKCQLVTSLFNDGLSGSPNFSLLKIRLNLQNKN